MPDDDKPQAQDSDGKPLPTANTDKPVEAQASAAAAPARQRDWWDKSEILLRPAAAFFTAVTVALIGWFGQQALNTRSVEETKRSMNSEQELTRRAELSQNYRLYTQLLSNREESESALRKDIFSSILNEFLAESGSDTGHENIRNRLLKLEILALNFGEALSLSPLFIELDKNIRTTIYNTDMALLDRADDRRRLESLAKRVSQQQFSALSTGGFGWDFEIPIAEYSSDSPYEWPYNADGNDHYSVVLEGVTRNYVFRFSRIDSIDHSVDVGLEIQVEGESTALERAFNLNFYNFPMVDNTRLANDQRFALIMTRFETKAIHFSAIIFPGKYSSQRDRPFLDDVIHRLRSEAMKQRELQ